MRLMVWLGRALIFFSLFAFALNNQQTVSLNWFFGHAWNAPMVMIVLAAFACGTVFGILAMAPNWWRQRRQARRPLPASAPMAPAANPPRQPDTPVLPPDGI